MKKGAIIALVAIATSLAAYAGMTNRVSIEKETPPTECCDKTECCPTGTEICK
jgi:hypothetical protein